MTTVQTLTTAKHSKFTEQVNLIALQPHRLALIGIVIVPPRYRWLFWRPWSYSVSWRE